MHEKEKLDMTSGGPVSMLHHRTYLQGYYLPFFLYSILTIYNYGISIQFHSKLLNSALLL